MIIQIEDKMVSSDVLTEYFCCDYAACGGACCLEGESGAPVTPRECRHLKEALPHFEAELPAANRAVIQRQGVSYIDQAGERVTSLVHGRQCVFALQTPQGGWICAAERWAEQSGAAFTKPMSCRLYPIRLTRYPTFTALNYDRWSICRPAVRLGRRRGILLYRFLQAPLVASFGEAFYEQLCAAARLLQEEPHPNP